MKTQINILLLLLVLLIITACGSRIDVTVKSPSTTALTPSGYTALTAINLPYNQETVVDFQYNTTSASCSINNISGNVIVYSAQIPALKSIITTIVNDMTNSADANLLIDVDYLAIKSYNNTILYGLNLTKSQYYTYFTNVKTKLDSLNAKITSGMYSNFSSTFNSDYLTFAPIYRDVLNQCDCINGTCSALMGLYGDPNQPMVAPVSFDYTINDGSLTYASTVKISRRVLPTELPPVTASQYQNVNYVHNTAINYDLHATNINNIIQAPTKGILIGCSATANACLYQPNNPLDFTASYGKVLVSTGNNGIQISPNRLGSNDLTIQHLRLANLNLKYVETPFVTVNGTQIQTYTAFGSTTNMAMVNLINSHLDASKFISASLANNLGTTFPNGIFLSYLSPISLSSVPSYDTLIYQSIDPATNAIQKNYIDILIN